MTNLNIYKAESLEKSNPIQITCSRDLIPSLKKFKLKEKFDFEAQEHFIVFALNGKNGFLSAKLISLGTIDECIVNPTEVFRFGILKKAKSLVLIHNHPSGVTSPSLEDVKLTNRLSECGRLMGLPILDHIIVSPKLDAYTSLRDKGLF